MKNFLLKHFIIFLFISTILITFGCGDKKAETPTRWDRAIDLKASDYDKLLSSKSIKFKGGINTSAGPVAFQLSKMLGKITSRNGQPVDDPFIDIKIWAITLPNFAIGGKELATITIEHIWDQEGSNVLNSKYSAAKEFCFSYEKDPFPHLSAGTTFLLNSGTTFADIKKIEGKFVFKLPVGVRTLSFNTLKDKGKVLTEACVKVELVSRRENIVRLQYEGSFDNQIGVIAFDASGKKLNNSGYAGGRFGDKADYSYQFEGKIDTVQVVLASGFVEREYPFIIEK